MKILCGFKGSGKSTLAQVCHSLWGLSIADTDTLIEAMYYSDTGRRLSCREIALDNGEEAFRRLEKSVIAKVSPTSCDLLSVGGGALEDAENRAALMAIGRLIYLRTEVDVLWERIAASGITPSYLDVQDPKASFEAIYHRRAKTFELHADYILDTYRHTPEVLASRLLQEGGLLISSPLGRDHG